MELKQNPFSFYDFLGYFTPGAIFLYCCFAISVHSGNTFISFETIARETGFGKADLYIPFILLAYTTGHILSFLSSITVERYAIWALGYPSKYLLGIASEGYFGMKEKRIIRGIVRVLVLVLLVPISFLDFFIGKLAGLRSLYAKNLDPLLVRIIVGKVDHLLTDHGGIESLHEYGDAKSANFFHYAYHYCVENSPNHLPKMQNYVALYGFLRTLTLISVLLFWFLIWQVCLHFQSYFYQFLVFVFLPLVSYVFFIAFIKFYGRFSLEALMALSVTYKKSNKFKHEGTS